MSKPTVIIKSEKRLLWRDPLFEGPENHPAAIVFAVLEQLLEEPHPLHGKSLFQLVVNTQNGLLTRKQMEGLKELIDTALSEISEGRVILPPPGTMIPHK